MEYRFSEQQQMLKKGLEAFLKKELPFETFTSITENENGFSKKLWKKLGENGWLGVLAKGELQALEDAGPLDLMYLGESIGEKIFPGPYTLTAGLIVPFLSQLKLSENQLELLNELVGGEKLITCALPLFGKADGQFDFIWPDLTINEDSEQLQLSGTIQNVPFIQHADAVLLPFKNQSGAISAVILPTDSRGMKIESDQAINLAKPQGSMILDEVPVRKNDLIEGTASNHQALLNEQLINYFISLNGEIIGGADEVLKRTIHYVKERKQFGVPVGSFQAVKHMIAEMHVEIEKARSYCVYTAAKLSNNPSESFMQAISTRLFTANVYKQVCETAIQLHGGMGFTWEESIHYWYKESMYQLAHITHPSMMNDFLLTRLLSQEELSKELQSHL